MAKCSALFILALFFMLALKALPQELHLSDIFDERPTKAPAHTTTKPKRHGKDLNDDLDLEDALNPKGDVKRAIADGFSDDLLFTEHYIHDKRKGEETLVTDTNKEKTTAEIGSIAGIASDVVNALVRAVSNYVSFQKNMLCFGIQMTESPNEEQVKGEKP